MKNKDQDYKVKNENYFILTLIIILLFILLMLIVNLNYFLRKNKEKSGVDIKNALQELKTEKKAMLTPSCLIISDEDKKDSKEIVEESLEKAKIGYISKAKFDDITNDELKSAKIIIININKFSNFGNVDMLFQYLKQGKDIIFTSMPEVDFIEKSELKEIMGINNITQSKNQKGVNFLPGFMLGGLLEFPELSYNAPEVELLSTTKTYVASSKKSPVIWRNIYSGSEIYVVNGPFIGTNAGYGIMSAIMAQINTDYIYPIINAKVFTYAGLPYMSYENTDELEKIYSRNAMQLQQDILIPDILSANKSRNFIPNGFFIDGFDKKDEDKINQYNEKQIANYERDIYKLGGEVGVVYSENFEKNIMTYQKLFNNNKFQSIKINEGDFEAINKLLDKEQYNFIEAVVGPWTVKKKSFEYINKNTVYIPFTIDGVDNTDLEKLEFYSGVTAYGAIIQNLDLKQVIFPKENKDNWMNVLRGYVKFIDSYRKKYEMIKSRNITETIQLVKKFESNSPSIEYANNEIKMKFEEWYGESYYILRTDKEIDSINNGTIEKIEDGAYLVTAKNKEIDIKLRQIDRYK